MTLIGIGDIKNKTEIMKDFSNSFIKKMCRMSLSILIHSRSVLRVEQGDTSRTHDDVTQ